MEGERETKWASQNNEKSADVFELRKLGTVLASTKDTISTKKDPADDDTLLEKAKLKTKDKVVSVWNNVKYGMRACVVGLFQSRLFERCSFSFVPYRIQLGF